MFVSAYSGDYLEKRKFFLEDGISVSRLLLFVFVVTFGKPLLHGKCRISSLGLDRSALLQLASSFFMTVSGHLSIV